MSKRRYFGTVLLTKLRLYLNTCPSLIRFSILPSALCLLDNMSPQPVTVSWRLWILILLCELCCPNCPSFGLVVLSGKPMSFGYVLSFSVLNSFCLFGCTVFGIIVPQPGTEAVPPAVELQSVNHCISREVP